MAPTRSPEIEAVVRRVLSAWQERDFATMTNLISPDPALRVTGFDDGEHWAGRDEFLAIFRTQIEEMPIWKEELLRVEGFEEGAWGWATVFGTMNTAEATSPIRHTAVLRLEAGAWRVIQWMNSIPVPNRQIFGVDLTTTLDNLVSSVLDEGHELSGWVGSEGTTTLVFTDIVDSTTMAESVGDVHWTSIVRTHETALRRIASREGGTIVKLLGDGAMLAFRSARGAVRAAIEIQESARQADYLVRIGIHTGDAISTGADYFGTTVNKAARIASTAGAGEIVISSTTADLAGSIAGIELEDGGLIALKGLSGTHQVFTIRR
jgi:class 3 adenylate cyclase